MTCYIQTTMSATVYLTTAAVATNNSLNSFGSPLQVAFKKYEELMLEMRVARPFLKERPKVTKGTRTLMLKMADVATAIPVAVGIDAATAVSQARVHYEVPVV